MSNRNKRVSPQNYLTLQNYPTLQNYLTESNWLGGTPARFLSNKIFSKLDTGLIVIIQDVGEAEIMAK